MVDGENDTLAPVAERLVSDVETLKALSDPLRLRILEAMVQAADEPWTVKRIAKALGVGPTKLYHHIRILEDSELIRPAGQQLVRGIVETSYRIAQLQLRLDRSLLASGAAEVRSSTEQAITSIFDLARRDLERALAAGLVVPGEGQDPKRVSILQRGLVKTTPERAAEFRDRLAALLAEFSSEPDGEITLGMLISVHPIPSSSDR
jgi:DNA-binding transcriptional ArsR family regulator